MFVAPATFKDFGQRLTREAAEALARNWWMLLVSGVLLVVAGMLIFSISWTTRGLATFIGVLFILEGTSTALATGIGASVRRANVVAGLLSIASGVVIILWPSPSVVVLGVFVGVWLIVVGSFTITASFAARPILPDWWLLLLIGVVEVPLGVLALASPGEALAAVVTVGGIWAVATGVLRIVLSFEMRNLPGKVVLGT